MNARSTSPWRYAKIIATIGPASADERTLRRLMLAGMDVARLNFSHGSHEEHGEIVRRIRYLSHRLGRPVAILQDLQGPKIRLGDLPKPITVHQGEEVIFVAGQEKTTEGIPVAFDEFAAFVRPGTRIAIDDGLLEFEVVDVDPPKVRARVLTGGVLKSHKGINLIGVPLDIPGFTEKDEADLAFGLEQDVDAIAVSFVRTAEDVARIRRAITEIAPEKVDTPIIAKLERREALDNLESILAVADGVMVARGDLGVEIPTEEVPIAQKRIIALANRYGKLVVTATQMLDSMVHNPRPTRAEASDVANAVFDGTDALMLSAETATGRYPVRAVETMDAIIRTAERHSDEWGVCSRRLADEALARAPNAWGLARAAKALAEQHPEVAALAVFTNTGRTAVLLSKTRPRVPILAFTPVERTYRRLSMYWGIRPHMVPFANTVEVMFKHVEAALRATGHVKAGQKVVLVAGFPVGAMRPPNFLLVHTIGMEA
ncbi:MAG: pyruvate kinase [Chloroflexi bacterium]|nr:pyruvate kinase [Chloroflexota bacterium]